MNSLVSGVRFALALGLCLPLAVPALAAESAAQAEMAAAKAPALDIVEGRAYGVLDG